jgi:hypothetical protein
MASREGPSVGAALMTVDVCGWRAAAIANVERGAA